MLGGNPVTGTTPLSPEPSLDGLDVHPCSSPVPFTLSRLSVPPVLDPLSGRLVSWTSSFALSFDRRTGSS